MPVEAEPTACTDQQLADEICTWSARVAAGEATLLRLIAEFDRREAWSGPGMLSCAHWLVWRTGLGAGAARERVRVARRLDDLPELAEAFDAGTMSWSQMRAVSRVADPDDGVDWVELARHSSGAQLEKIVRGIRRVQTIEAREADPDQAGYTMRTRTRYADDGSLVITVYASAEDGAVILAGLAAERGRLARRRSAESAHDVAAAEPAETAEPAHVPEPILEPAERPGDPVKDRDKQSQRGHGVPAGTPWPAPAPTPAPVTDGEALLALAQRALDTQQQQSPAAARRDRPRLRPQIDPLTGWARLSDGELLPPGGLTDLLFTGPVVAGVLRLRPLTAADLVRHDLGRGAREVSPALRELLGCLDGERCRFPGCTRRGSLQAHHVRFWSYGGSTDLANLVLLCSRHHTLVHRDGFALQLAADRRLHVTTAAGEVVEHHPDRSAASAVELDPVRRAGPEDLGPTHATARMDLGYVVSVLLQQAA